MAIDLKTYSRIPSIPTVAVEILKAYSDPDSSLDQISAIIKNDPAIVGKILKAANSAHYGSRGEVTELKRAVMMLGRNSVTPLVLSFSLAQQSVDSSAHKEHYQRIWFRSFVQATAAEVLGGQFGAPQFKGECYTINLLAGIGKLALLRAEPHRYLSCLQKSEAEGASLAKTEEAVLGFNHMELSAGLLRLLGIPERCVAPIENFGKADSEIRNKDAAFQRLLYVSRAADATACLICDRTPGVAIVSLETALQDLALPIPMTSEALIGIVQERIETTAGLFDISPPTLPSPNELLQEALEQLSWFAVQSSDVKRQAAVPTELREENGRLQRRVADLLEATRVDNLTGINNRAWFVSQLAERVALHRVRQQAVGLAVLDIDHFKKINDTFGHQAGDYVLQMVARGLQATVRESDLLARYGGEEFVVLMNDANEPGLHVVGERMRAAVEQIKIEFEGNLIPVTVSIGLTQSLVIGDETTFGSQLFAAADAAMYCAKRTGRNRFCVEAISNVVTSEKPDAGAKGSGRPAMAFTH
jgi:diguanylate cyclase (GGDEF)-like protein